MTTRERIREARQDLQRKQQGCQSDWGYVLPEYRFDWQDLQRQINAYTRCLAELQELGIN